MDEKNLEKVQQGIDAMLAKQAAMEAETKAATERAAAAEAKAEALEKAHADGMSEVRALLALKTSDPEAKELEKGFSQFVRDAWLNFKYQRPMPAGHEQPHREYNEKAVADFVTTTDATAGYLVPRQYNDLIITANGMYGQLMPRLNNVIRVPAGVTMPVNARSTNPTATWDLQSVDMDEAEFVYGQDTVSPKRLSLYIKAANEMLAAPNTGFTANITDAFLRAVVTAKETAIIAGTAGATTAPSDGILVHSSVSDKTNITSTVAGLWAFIAEAVQQNPDMLNPQDALFVIPPLKYFTIAGLISGDASTGIATYVNGVLRLGGWEVIPHPACTLSGPVYWACGFNPRDLVVADSQDLAFDFNPFAGTGGAAGGWVANETWIRAVTHMDWSLGGSLASKFSKADFS